jgi:hypothetical protein
MKCNFSVLNPPSKVDRFSPIDTPRGILHFFGIRATFADHPLSCTHAIVKGKERRKEAIVPGDCSMVRADPGLTPFCPTTAPAPAPTL